MVELEATPGRSCKINNEEYLFFSGYSYLGMSHIKAFTDLVKEGIDKYGVLFPSSRISNTILKLFHKFEDDLSSKLETADTVTFSSGLLAGKTISSILSSFKNIYVAPATHPAIKPEHHEEENLSFSDWSRQITELINSSNENEFVIVCDSINILTAETHDLSFIKNIVENKKIIVLIDDSHGIGIIGEDGKGITSQLFHAPNVEYIISYSLSKAFNIHGGAVSCSKYWSEQLRHHSNYTASTSINPSLIHAYLNAKNLYTIERDKLLKNIKYFKSKLPVLSIQQSAFDLPMFICNIKNAEEYFYKNKVIISSFRYPHPYSDNVSRIVINALHTKDDIDKLFSLL